MIILRLDTVKLLIARRLNPGDNNMDGDNDHTEAGHCATGGTLVGRICSVLQ